MKMNQPDKDWRKKGFRENSSPEKSSSETNALEANAVEANAPETNALETSALETNAREANDLETSARETNPLEHNSVDTNSLEHNSLEKNSLESRSPGNSVDEDLLFEKLRALPSLSPSPELTQRVAQAALAELAVYAGTSTSAAPVPGWRSYLEFALYRAALPSALAGATLVYLSWAITAASHLY